MLQDVESIRTLIQDQLKKNTLNRKSIFFAVTKENLALLNAQIRQFQQLQKTVPNTVLSKAEAFSAEVVSVFYKSLIMGELRRLLLDSPRNPLRTNQLKEIDLLIDERVRFIEEHSEIQMIPISSLVEFQLEFLVRALDQL